MTKTANRIQNAIFAGLIGSVMIAGAMNGGCDGKSQPKTHRAEGLKLLPEHYTVEEVCLEGQIVFLVNGGSATASIVQKWSSSLGTPYPARCEVK